MSKWNTSVNILLMNFKGALSSLIPWLMKSKIPINERDTYDDWDAITSTLYETMVVNSIHFSEGFESNILGFAKYDHHYENYNGLDFIISENPKDSDKLTVFVSFVGNNNLEMINVCKISKTSLQFISNAKMMFTDANFFLYKNPLIDKLIIEL